jgi:hypothetical protein
MTASGNCPNCGSTLAPGAIACARCGHQLSDPAPPEAPPGGPSFSKPPASVPSAIDVASIIADTRRRWGVENNNIFLAAAVMAVIAFLISTVAGPSLVAADAEAFNRRIDNSVWLQLAFGLALGAASLAVLIRWQSGPPERSGASQMDFRIGAGLAGVTLVFVLLGLIKGFDGSFDGVDSWSRYANVYAMLVLAVFAISRPVPSRLGGTESTLVGLVAVCVSVAGLVIGQFMGLSDQNDTFVNGLAFQNLGVILMTLSLAWFLGLQPRAS